jgi:hypothetical protein
MYPSLETTLAFRRNHISAPHVDNPNGVKESRMMFLRGWVCAAVLLWSAVTYAAAAPEDLSIEVSVVDPANQPVPFFSAMIASSRVQASLLGRGWRDLLKQKAR